MAAPAVDAPVAAAPVVAASVVEPTEPHFDVKLFNRWSFDDVQVCNHYFQFCAFQYHEWNFMWF